MSLVTNSVVNYYLSQHTADHIVSYDTVCRMDTYSSYGHTCTILAFG